MIRTYLDHNATSPLRPEARALMLEAFDQVGNASAINGHGRAAAKFVNQAREELGLAMGVCAQDIIFTGSGTESDNTAIHSAIQNGTRRILISGMDHPATFMAARNMGVAHESIPVSQDGVTDTDWLRERLASWDEADDRRGARYRNSRRPRPCGRRSYPSRCRPSAGQISLGV